MIPAFGYLRVSGKGQLHDDADGLPRQRRAIARYAEKHGLEIVEWFEERGVSGTTDWENRPSWVDCIAAIGDVKTIVIERLDRLARDLGVQEHVIKELQRREITLISTAEPDLGSQDPTRILFRQILGAVAQFDRAMIEAKLRSARHQMRVKTGRCEGAKPFGMKPGEEETIATILELRRRGWKTRTLADWLNASGRPTRSGKPWHFSTVAKIIANDIRRHRRMQAKQISLASVSETM
jgi:DNA invertase Pin-like site-specific DNA recombinase